MHSVRQDLSIQPLPDFRLVTHSPMSVRAMLTDQTSIEQTAAPLAFMVDLMPRSLRIDGASYVVSERVFCEHRPNPAARTGRKRWRGGQKLLAEGSLVHSPG
jgi:hypothetical protein